MERRTGRVPWDDEPAKRLLPKNQWQNLPAGAPMPFSDIPLVGITKVKDKPITVVDWALLRGYNDEKGKYHFTGCAIIVLDCGGEMVKIKVANNPKMNARLKEETGTFKAVIRRGIGGFNFT